MDIFKNESDYSRFLELLYLANSTEPIDMQKLLREGLTFTDIMKYKKKETLVDIGAFCLMSNHFHLLVSPLVENGISKFMQKLITGYVMYFNKKYARSGVLFQGRFGSQYIEEDRHLQYLFSYIHLNPIKLKKPLWENESAQHLSSYMDFAFKYPYSSIRSYLGENNPLNSITKISKVPWRFASAKKFKNELLSWIDQKSSVKV